MHSTRIFRVRRVALSLQAWTIFRRVQMGRGKEEECERVEVLVSQQPNCCWIPAGPVEPPARPPLRAISRHKRVIVARLTLRSRLLFIVASGLALTGGRTLEATRYRNDQSKLCRPVPEGWHEAAVVDICVVRADNLSFVGATQHFGGSFG